MYPMYLEPTSFSLRTLNALWPAESSPCFAAAIPGTCFARCPKWLNISMSGRGLHHKNMAASYAGDSVAVLVHCDVSLQTANEGMDGKEWTSSLEVLGNRSKGSKTNPFPNPRPERPGERCTAASKLRTLPSMACRQACAGVNSCFAWPPAAAPASIDQAHPAAALSSASPALTLTKTLRFLCSSSHEAEMSTYRSTPSTVTFPPVKHSRKLLQLSANLHVACGSRSSTKPKGLVRPAASGRLQIHQSPALQIRDRSCTAPTVPEHPAPRHKDQVTIRSLPRPP